MRLAPRITQASPASLSPVSSSVKWVSCEDEAKLCFWDSNSGGIGQDGVPACLGLMGAVSPGASWVWIILSQPPAGFLISFRALLKCHLPDQAASISTLPPSTHLRPLSPPTLLFLFSAPLEPLVYLSIVHLSPLECQPQEGRNFLLFTAVSPGPRNFPK